MADDPYTISSNFRPKKSATECDVEEFFKTFENFYMNVLMKKTPDLPHKICDPYGFALLCEDYKDIGENEYEGKKKNYSNEYSFNF